MKVLKSLILTLIALSITGCYTQLQYTSKMKRITDRPDNGGYVESQPGTQQQAADASYDSAYYGTDEDYVPIYYKDYAYANGWNYDGYPYVVNNFYGYNYYDPFLTLGPSYFYRWHPYRYYGYHRPYFGSRFNFSITFGWGWGDPYYYDPFFYDPFYDYYYGGYYHPFAYGYYGYYGYYGHHGYYGYHGSKGTSRSNVRYGPRTIGTNRVDGNSGTRSRDANVTTRRNSTVSNGTTVRTRSIGATRTQSTGTTSRTSGTAVTRSRTRTNATNNTGTTRTRSRSTVQQNNTRSRQAPANRSRGNVRNNHDQQAPAAVIRSRSNLDRNPAQRLENRSDIRERVLRNQRASTPPQNAIEHMRQNHPTFLQRLGNFIGNTGRSISNSSSSRSPVRIRAPRSSSSHHSTISRSSSSHRSTVTRSRSSSSSHSRSRGSSSRSRSSHSSGGSSRSRGHH